MLLPRDHPQRRELNDEVHARPPEALEAPLRLSYLALRSDWSQRQTELDHLAALLGRFGLPPPAADASHVSAALGGFRLVWERHTEFARYTIIVPGLASAEDPFAAPAIDAAPADWIAALPGEVMVAAHAAIQPAGEGPPDHEAIAARLFAGNALVGAGVGDAAVALTDFRIQADGFSRILLLDRGVTPRQAGRLVQRLLEIDTYRVMALLAFPVARTLAPFLAQRERALAEITTSLAGAAGIDEPGLLERLTRLEAEIDASEAAHHYRFGAAIAYHELVRRRIGELREVRIRGLQPFGEFTERRLAPAMNTCLSVSRRLESLSQRVARATQLLSTRVEVQRAAQQRQVLESMNRRAAMQLRLQSTVEGLSAVAITYYLVGLIGYAAKGLGAVGLKLDQEAVLLVSIPLTALAVVAAVRKLRAFVRGAIDQHG
ncbi:MAG: DUF3422 domain-containing protein [Thalassobaculales bacterium]